MAEARPKLEVVSGDGERPEPAPASRARGLLAWVLGALLAVALIGLGLESRRAEELSAQVEVLSAELLAAQAALESYRSHLDEVRASVAELQALVERDPISPSPEAR